jgi:hypothetical protein
MLHPTSSMELTDVTSGAAFFEVFCLQLPFPSQTISLVWQFAPGALQSIWIGGKLGNWGWLFHWAAAAAIKQHKVNKRSLFILNAAKLWFFPSCFRLRLSGLKTCTQLSARFGAAKVFLCFFVSCGAHFLSMEVVFLSSLLSLCLTSGRNCRN